MKLKFWEADSYTWTDRYVEPTKTFLWNNKEIVAGTVAAAVITLLVLRCLRKPVAQKPIVTFDTTLNLARLNVEAPAGKKAAPPNVNITFLIDQSSSMSGDREKEVKQGVLNILTDAKARADKGANFEVGIMGFNDKPSIISEPKNIKSLKAIEKELMAYTSSGGTQTLTGLSEATESVETLAKTSRAAKNVLILLTDGEDNVSKEQMEPLHKRLSALNAQLFAIGIGDAHKKTTLQNIAGKNYIDTTAGAHTIITAISQIYNEVISSYSDLKLSSTLKPGTWSVNRVQSYGRSECDLGTLVEGKKMERFIQIHGDKLGADLPLSKVKFILSFTDPRGIPGQMPLHWKANTTINHALCKSAQSYI